MKTLLDQARQRLADGDTAACLDTLRLAIDTLSHTNQTVYRDQLVLISSAFAQHQRKTINGTLSSAEASVELAQINERTLQLIQDIDSGRLPEELKPKRQMRILAVLALALVAMAGGFWLYRQTKLECPTHRPEAKWKISVLPLINLGETKAKPELVISKTINELTAKNNLSAEAVVWNTDSENLLKDKQSAMATCGTDLLVTGDYLVLKSDSIVVSLTYQFSDKRPPISTEFAGFSNVTALREGLMEQRSMQDAIFSLCTILALRENNSALAEKWLKKIGTPKRWEVDMRKEMKEGQ